MGRFIYGATSVDVQIDDRALAHLRAAIFTKLRRNESFMFDVEIGGGHGRRTFWIHPSLPLQFHFTNERIALNRSWVDEMVRLASGNHGLQVPPEPVLERADA